MYLIDRIDPLWGQIALEVGALALFSVGAGFLARALVPRFVRMWRFALQGNEMAARVVQEPVLERLARALPSIVVQLGVHWLEHLPQKSALTLGNIAAAFTTYHLMRAVVALIDALTGALEQSGSKTSYAQLGKLLTYIVGCLLIVATLLNRSPLLLLSGLGAMSAVLMLVFKDTILSFVAGVQLASNDMLRVGDWIEMPKEGADGAVLDVGLNTVKVQNWDKTITHIPTWKLMSESFKNWRGMSASGGRRIMRSLNIDASTVCIDKNDPDAKSTNLGNFVAYAREYLLQHPEIVKTPGMTLMVRTLEPSALGIPVQLYCFTTTAWIEYERVQGEVIDHLIGKLPDFGLALYQRSSDRQKHK